MRLNQLNLLRFGHFTDKQLQFPEPAETGADLHIVFGPNEAGKSTTLAAIENALFGIPKSPEYNFLHENKAMRVGAELQNGAIQLEFMRRKGTKNTLLDTEGQSLKDGETQLSDMLGGADNALFTRMFCLDHTRLAEGGKDIINAKDDIGQMLLSAGAGMSGLRETLKNLTEEATDQWAPRRANDRAFYQAEDKLKAARKLLRDNTLSGKRWRELRDKAASAHERHAEIEQQLKQAATDLSRASRIRRVGSDVQRLQSLHASLATHAATVALPENAAELLNQAELAQSIAKSRLLDLTNDRQKVNEQLQALTLDEALLNRAEDIHALAERRTEAAVAQAELPKRQHALETAEAALRSLGAELDWQEPTSDQLIKRIPTRPATAAIRKLAADHGQLQSAQATSERALATAEQTLALATEALQNTRNPNNSNSNTLERPIETTLDNVVDTLREQGDIQGRATSADKLLLQANQKVERLLAALQPAAVDEATLLGTPAPTRNQIQSHAHQLRAAQQEQSQNAQNIKVLEAELSEVNTTRDTFNARQHTISDTELAAARAQRNTLWQLIKQQHIDGKPLTAQQQEVARQEFAGDLTELSTALDPAIANSDSLADQRFDNAEAVGHMAGLTRQIETLTQRLKTAEAERLAAAGAIADLSAQWQALWAGSAVTPLDPDSMLRWLDQREEVIQATYERDEATSAVASANGEVAQARSLLISTLTSLPVNSLTEAELASDTLPLLLNKATTQQKSLTSQRATAVALQEKLQAAKTAVAERTADQQSAVTQWQNWQQAWETELAHLGFSAELTPTAVEEQISVVDQMRESARDITTLRTSEINQLEATLASFRGSATTLVAELAPDLTGTLAESATATLTTRLAEAQRVRERQLDRQQALQQLEERIADAETEHNTARASVQHLLTIAAADSQASLKSAIERSDEQRKLRAEQEQLNVKLLAAGDGHTLEHLASECAAVNMDEVAGQEAAISANIEELQALLTTATEQRSAADQEFSAMGEHNIAATAASDKQQALAEMQEAVENYLRVHTSATVLKWSIEQYRKSKQAPLLTRASELFATLSQQSFTGLRVVYTDQDEPRLHGERPDGSVLQVSAMSSGTADQLYLALRVASVEDYQSRSAPLPFIADDLFINFDDARAGAGFNVLAELARSTQVLFFTHNRHLVEIAEATLNKNSSKKLTVLRLDS